MPASSLIEAVDPHAAAAECAAGAIERLAGELPRVRVAVTGGSAAAAVSATWARLAARSFPFERLHLTWIDERCVPASSPESNHGALRLDPAPGVRLPLYLDGEAPAEAVTRVAHELAATFGGALDYVLLGMGPDGHIASLFPGRPDPAGLVAHVADSPKPPPDRITLTRAMLATARHTLLVAGGEAKRAALVRLVANDPALPAVGLPDLVIVTDQQLGESS